MPVPLTRRRPAALASRGTADAAFSGMKPLFLLVLLALGPALAEQFPIVPHVVSDAAVESPGTAPAAVAQEAERIWLCGR